MIDFEPDPSDAALAKRTATFVRDQVIPFENDERWTAHGPTDGLRDELTKLAKNAGLLSPLVFEEAVLWSVSSVQS